MNRLKSAALREVVQHELERGNEIAEYATGWSKMDLVVRLKNPPDPDFLRVTAKKYSFAHTFQTRDPHYASEACGIVDDREAVTGPKQ